MVANAATSILERLIKPAQATLPAEAARALLRIQFDDADRARMTELTTKARHGTLEPPEREELDGYLEVGLLIDLLQSKARLSLKNTGAVA